MRFLLCAAFAALVAGCSSDSRWGSISSVSRNPGVVSGARDVRGQTSSQPSIAETPSAQTSDAPQTDPRDPKGTRNYSAPEELKKDKDIVEITVDSNVQADRQRLVSYLFKLGDEWLLVGSSSPNENPRTYRFMRVGAPDTLIDPLLVDEEGKPILDLRALTGIDSNDFAPGPQPNTKKIEMEDIENATSPK